MNRNHKTAVDVDISVQTIQSNTNTQSTSTVSANVYVVDKDILNFSSNASYNFAPFRQLLTNSDKFKQTYSIVFISYR